MNANKFKGTGVALVTPFNSDKSIDFTALKALVNQVIDEGVNFLVALGTTAETPTLSQEEKMQVLNTVIETNAKRLPIVCGIGGSNTAEIIHYLQTYPLQDVDAILSVTPYYSKPTQAGLIAHFKEISAHSPVPIILYNVPGRTGVNMTAQTSITIANECKNVIAIKEASGNMVQCMELVKNKPADFLLLSGDDNLVMAQIACGFDGVISVAANCFTTHFCQMVNASLAHQFTKAQQLHYQLLDGIDLLFVEGNPAGAKCVMALQNRMQNELRLPVVPVSVSTQEAIATWLKK